jgi:DHA1 family bicyclomycin/chloramphenicol resistance-like MFS transporter
MSFPELVAFIAACMALNALGIDTMLPALAEIADELGVTRENHRQAVILAYLLAFGASQVVYGPLSDRFGRRPVLLGGLAIFVAGSVAAMLAGSFTTLLLARALQGLGAGGPRVVAMAIARDRFEGPMLGQVMSLAMMVLMVVPVIAPSFGQWILLVAPWRWIFSALFACGVGLVAWTLWRLDETLAPERRRRISAAAVVGGYREFLACRESLVHTMGMVLIMGILFAFVMSSQQVLVDLYGVGAAFPLLIALVAGVMAVGAFLNARLVMTFGPRRLSRVALVMMVATTALMALLAISGLLPLPVFVLFESIAMLLFGLVGPNLNTLAMQPMAHIAGTASAALGTTTTILAALLGFAIGQAFDHTVVPLTVGNFLLCAACWALLRFAAPGMPAASRQAY